MTLEVEPTRQHSSRRGAIAVGLLLIGLLCLGLWRVVSGSEHQAFAEGATPAASYKVTANHSYSLAVPGGVPAMRKHGIPKVTNQNGDALGLVCEWSIDGSANQALSLSIESLDTKAVTKVASFVAPATGDLSVSCDGWGPVFIPDAASGSSDPSGWFLLLSILALTAGAGLGLSAMYRSSLRRSQ